MFFNSDLLTKRGALAQVWMASHLTTKLSKSTLSSTSIPKSVQSILGQELLPMALRLSGQLLLGIARIYAKKTRYLLDDAQETLNKVRKAFQNEGRAAVDLPEDGTAGADDGHGKRGDINLRREGGDLEDLLALEFADNEWSLEKHLAAAAKDKGKAKAKNTTADIRDITLDEDFGAYGGALDFGVDDLGLDFGGIDDMGFDPEFQLFGDDELNAIAGPSSEKRGTKRARGEDGEERDEDDVSVEQGRRDSVALSSGASMARSSGKLFSPLASTFGEDWGKTLPPRESEAPPLVPFPYNVARPPVSPTRNARSHSFAGRENVYIAPAHHRNSIHCIIPPSTSSGAPSPPSPTMPRHARRASRMSIAPLTPILPQSPELHPIDEMTCAMQATAAYVPSTASPVRNRLQRGMTF